MTFSTEFEPAGTLEAHHRVVIFIGRQVLVHRTSGELLHRQVSVQALDLPTAEAVHLGFWHGDSCYALELDTGANLDLEQFAAVDLRSQLQVLNGTLFDIAGRALQLLHWRKYHRFCGYCGSPTRALESERVLQCTQCETLYYPKIAPCVIGLVVRGEQCLLARNARFAEPMFSAIAGFIEPGETAEAALKREVDEEVGLAVDRLEYISSQSWPFPSQLMFGFIAHYSGGEITVDGDEIVEANWYAAHNLPRIPPPETIAGTLIRTFVERCGRN